MRFTIHTVETVPKGSQPLLEKSLKAWRMIPHLHAVMPESPQSLQAYQDLHHLFTNTSVVAEERSVESLADAKLESICQFTIAPEKKNRQVSNEEQAAFLAASYEPKYALEVLVGIAQKTLSFVVNQLAQMPLDDFAKKYAWTPSLTNETQGAS